MAQERIDARGWLIGMAKGFHPATLHFSSANWTISDILPITTSGNTIGYSFAIGLTGALRQFEFAEGTSA